MLHTSLHRVSHGISKKNCFFGGGSENITGKRSSSHLGDGLKWLSPSEWKLWAASLGSAMTVGVPPGSLWLDLRSGHVSLPDSALALGEWLAVTIGFLLGSRGSPLSQQGSGSSESDWEEDSTTMLGRERGEGKGSLWDSCSFIMWWITEAALKACYWTTHREKGLHESGEKNNY